MCRRGESKHAVAGCSVLERAARDHERLADGRDGCVAERLRQMSDDRAACGRGGTRRSCRASVSRCSRRRCTRCRRSSAAVESELARRQMGDDGRAARCSDRRGRCRRAATRRSRRRRRRRCRRAPPRRCRVARTAAGRSSTSSGSRRRSPCRRRCRRVEPSEQDDAAAVRDVRRIHQRHREGAGDGLGEVAPHRERYGPSRRASRWWSRPSSFHARAVGCSRRRTTTATTVPSARATTSAIRSRERMRPCCPRGHDRCLNAAYAASSASSRPSRSRRQSSV